MTDHATLQVEWLQEAYDRGREAAEAAATWTVDGNTAADHAGRVLTMMRDGDPQADEYLPRRPDLSGEWADEPTPASLALDIINLEEYGSISYGELAEIQNAIAEEFERGVAETFESACEAELVRFLALRCPDCGSDHVAPPHGHHLANEEARRILATRRRVLRDMPQVQVRVPAAPWLIVGQRVSSPAMTREGGR